MGMSTKERVAELTDQIEEGIKALFESDHYKAYLETMSKFYNYSTNNIILISMQRPDATCVAGYNAWKNKFDRHVKEGAQGIRILQPAPYRVSVKEPELDKSGAPVLNPDGSQKMQTSEKLIPSYKVGYVFAYEDTEGTPLPRIISVLTDNVKQYALMKELIEKISPAPIVYEPIEGSANGYYSLQDRKIHIKDKLPELQTIKTMIHEMAHAMLHDAEVGIHKDTDRNEKEVEAESVAYTVLSYYGLDTSEYSFGYIAGWSKTRELAELKTCMDKIRMVSGVIINKLDDAIQQEKLCESVEAAYKFPDGSYLYIVPVENGFRWTALDRWGKVQNTDTVESNQPLAHIVDSIMRENQKDPSEASLWDASLVQAKIEQASQLPQAEQQKERKHRVRR